MALLKRHSDKVDVLASVPLFAGLSKKELSEIARSVTEVEYSPREFLTREGERGLEAMVILDGSAVVRRKGRKIAELKAGDVVGEMSIVTDLPRNATVQAQTFVSALLMSRGELAALMDESPKVAVKILRTVAERLAAATGDH